jgi:hypothetical protein
MTMRRVLPFVLMLCAVPVITEAQQRVIVGNTLMDLGPGYTVVADAGRGHGKGHGRGAPSPGPSVSPTPATPPAPPAQPGGEIGRGEGSFQFVPSGSVIIPPVAQVQPVPPPMAQPRVEAPCAECGTTVTVPVQLHLRAAVQALPAQAQGYQAPVQLYQRPHPCP